MSRQPDNAGLGAFRLSVYAGRDASGEPVLTREGSGEDWRASERLRIPGFSDSYSVSLAGVWAELMRQRRRHLTRTVTGYETIIKFGNTMQLKEDFLVVIHAEFQER